MTVQAGIGRTEHVGQRLTVLVDEVLEEQVIARSYADAPEIDRTVILLGPSDLDPGDFIEVEVRGAHDHDLWVHPMED
jgi:ribosomal protein S12 methylthiotransferase